MTLQDYLNLVTDSLGNYINYKGSIGIPIVVALIILFLGLVVATVLKRVWVEIVKFLGLEKTFSGLDFYSLLTKTNKNLSLTEIVGSIIWWSVVIVFLVPALKALGINQVDQALGQLFGYIPIAIIAALYLSVGSLIAWFAYLIVLGVGSLIKVPAAGSIAKLVSVAIVVFSLLLSLKALGVSEEMVRFIVLGTIAASALALGLAGKDFAADILKKTREIIK